LGKEKSGSGGVKQASCFSHQNAQGGLQRMIPAKNRYDAKRLAWLKSSRVGFFLRVCAGRRDAFFSNWSACRCALSAFVRFSDTRIVSHRSCSLDKAAGFNRLTSGASINSASGKNEPPKRRRLPGRQSQPNLLVSRPGLLLRLRIMERIDPCR
jgi:hypothetical protein